MTLDSGAQKALRDSKSLLHDDTWNIMQSFKLQNAKKDW